MRKSKSSSKNKHTSDLPPEVEAVLRTAPVIQGCGRFRHVGVDRFVRHIQRDKCEKCRAFLMQMIREQAMMEFLRRSKN